MLRCPLLLLFMIFVTGCSQGVVLEDDDVANAQQAEPANDGKGIIGKKTQEIGEFDPAAGRIVSDSKVKVSNPLTGPLEAMGPLMEKVSKLGVDHSLALFHATNGYYPKTHKQFMDEIIYANNLRLPVLPAGAEYQYDVANHKLVVVEAEGR